MTKNETWLNTEQESSYYYSERVKRDVEVAGDFNQECGGTLVQGADISTQSCRLKSRFHHKDLNSFIAITAQRKSSHGHSYVSDGSQSPHDSPDAAHWHRPP